MIRTSWQRRKYALAVRLSPPQLRAYFRDFRLTLVCLNCRFGRAEALADSAKSVAQKRLGINVTMLGCRRDASGSSSSSSGSSGGGSSSSSSGGGGGGGGSSSSSSGGGGGGGSGSVSGSRRDCAIGGLLLALEASDPTAAGRLRQHSGAVDGGVKSLKRLCPTVEAAECGYRLKKVRLHADAGSRPSALLLAMLRHDTPVVATLLPASGVTTHAVGIAAGRVFDVCESRALRLSLQNLH
eukprot:COSAG06_NODE_12744_length_1335_cov_1.389159_3_plen_239_part_01